MPNLIRRSLSCSWTYLDFICESNFFHYSVLFLLSRTFDLLSGFGWYPESHVRLSDMKDTCNVFYLKKSALWKCSWSRNILSNVFLFVLRKKKHHLMAFVTHRLSIFAFNSVFFFVWIRSNWIICLQYLAVVIGLHVSCTTYQTNDQAHEIVWVFFMFCF